MRCLLASGLFLLASGLAQAEEVKPLTRDEPIVRMVLMEANNEPFSGMVAVAGVALDRIEDERWPSTEKDVIYQPYQFTGMSQKIKNFKSTEISRARSAVFTAKTGIRPCGRVLWYHNQSVAPTWADRLRLVCRIGAHSFYRDPS